MHLSLKKIFMIKGLLFIPLFLHAECCWEETPICPSPSYPPCELKECQFINSAYRFMPCEKEATISFFGDFLYWAAKEGGLDYTITSHTPFRQDFVDAILTLPPANDGKIKNIHAAWTPGYRIGTVLYFDHDDWNLSFDWIHLDPKKTGGARTNGDPSKQVFSSWTPPSSGLEYALDGVRARWKLNFNNINAELRRNFWFGECLTIEPKLGLQTAWIYQQFNISYFDVSNVQFPPASFQQVNVRTKNRSWNLGPRIGLNASWNLNSHWDLYSSAAGSLLFSWFNLKNKVTHTPSNNEVDPVSDPALKLQSRLRSVKSDLEWELGIEWKADLFQQAYLRIKVGWEQQYWFGQNLMNRFVSGSSPSAILSEHEDLSFGGIVVGGQLNF